MSRIVNMRKSLPVLIWRTLKWHALNYSSGQCFPLAATFQLTNRCNLRCVMCNIPNNPRQKVLPLQTFASIAEELSSMGCCYASLSGGEVLTINNFFDYLHSAKRHIPSVNTVTNGLLLDKGAAQEFCRTGADSVSISLDGMERTHELTRGKPGSFRKTVEAIENLKRYAPSVKVVVNTVIAPWNMDEIPELTMFVERLGVYQKFQPLNEHPLFEGQSAPYQVRAKGEFDVGKVRNLLDFLKRRRSVVNSGYFLKSMPGYISGEGANGLFKEKCLLPRFLCEFREDGTMYPCLGGMRWQGGHDVNKGVRNIFKSPEYRASIKRLEDCSFCRKSYSVCYIEPRVNFPIGSFLRYRVLSGLAGRA